MGKKVLLLIMTAIMLVQLAVPINASAKTEPSVTLVSGYYLDDMLYTFIQKNTNKSISKMGFNLETDCYSSADGYVFDQVEKNEIPVSYMLLIDLSTSMPGYRDRVRSFAESLMQSEKTDIQVTVASFGERFEVVAKDLTKKDKLMATINELKYDQNATDICGGVNKALKYLSNTERKEGELVNMILITDGVPCLPDSISNQQQVIEKSAKKTKKLLSKTSDVVVHSLGFGTWNTTTFNAISKESGLHLTAYSSYDAQTAAAEIAEFTDSLYPLDFSISISNNTRRFDCNLLINFKNKSLLESIKGKSIVNLNALYEKNSGKSYDSQPIISSGGTAKNKKPTEEETISTTEPETTEATETASTKNTKLKNVAKEEKIEDQFPMQIIIVASALSAVLLAIIIFAVIMIRKKPQDISDIKVEMKLEVIKGNCKNAKNVITLSKELTVGRRSSCDIVFSDKSVAPKNTRIYIDNDIVYIENIGSEINTAIGGMKIYSPNRLRSGDEISVGNAVFRLLF